MSPIRIAYIVEATTGGVARHLMDLLGHLDPAAFAPVLYCSFDRPESWADRLRGFAAERKIPLRECSMSRVADGRALACLREWIAADAVDLLHLHSARAGYLGRLAARTTNVPVIYTPHAFPFQRTTDWLRFLYARVERRLARETARIICVSPGECDEALAAGLPEDRLVIIPNGIDPDAWPVPTPAQRAEARGELGIVDSDVVIGALARLVPQKGLDLLLQAAEEVLGDFPAARIVIWGEGPQRRALWRLAKRHCGDRVRFAGETADPWRAYAAMDVFCAPSRWEAGPYSVLEAMACGLPVVASDVAGHIDYLLDDVTGKLFESDVPGPLAGALHALLADQDVRDAFGAAARAHVARAYPLPRMAAATASVYRQVLQRS